MLVVTDVSGTFDNLSTEDSADQHPGFEVRVSPIPSTLLSCRIMSCRAFAFCWLLFVQDRDEVCSYGVIQVMMMLTNAYGLLQVKLSLNRALASLHVKAMCYFTLLLTLPTLLPTLLSQQLYLHQTSVPLFCLSPLRIYIFCYVLVLYFGEKNMVLDRKLISPLFRSQDLTDIFQALCASLHILI